MSRFNYYAFTVFRILTVFQVDFFKSEVILTCSCKLFELEGFLCRHFFYVLRMRKIKEYPKRYILRRWTKDVVPPPSYGSSFSRHDISENKEEIQTLIRESVFFLESAVDRLVNDPSKLALFRDKQKELMEQVFIDMPYQLPMKNNEVIATLLGVTQPQPEEIVTGNPNICGNKGGIRGKKRLITLKNQAISKSQKPNGRRCNYCEEYVFDHDSRNCPKKKEDQLKELEAQKQKGRK